jgi:hypothetical protein
VKIVQIDSDKLHVTDDDKARGLLFLFLAIIGILIMAIPIYVSYQDGAFQLIFSSILIGLTLLLTGLYGLISREVSNCYIDRATGIINITITSPIRSRALDFEVSQVSSIELKEITSIYYHVYVINFLLNNRKSIPLTIYSNKERSVMKTLSDRVAEFINVEIKFSRSQEPLIPIIPGF